MRETFFGCCASAAKLRTKSIAPRARRMTFLFMFFSHASRLTAFSFDHLIRPREHVDWNCQTNLFCRLKVDDEFKLRCLWTGKSAGLAPFKILST